MEKFEEVRNYMFKSSVQETIIKVKLSISMLLIPLEKEKKKKLINETIGRYLKMEVIELKRRGVEV